MYRGLVISLFLVITGCALYKYTGIGYGDTEPIHLAAERGNVDEIKILLGQGSGVNKKANKTKATPLHHAAWCGQYRAAKLLIESGAKLNSKTAGKNTPLHYAVGAEGNCWDHTAPTEGHIKTARLLIDKGALIDPRNADGITPLQDAARHNMLAIAEELIDLGANIDNRASQYSVLETAAYWSSDIELLLIKKGAQVDTSDELSGVSPLTIAIKKGNIKSVKALLKKGVDLNQKPKSNAPTPLGLAVKKGNLKVVKLLLEADANPNMPSSYQHRITLAPLIIAIKEGHTSIFRLLIQFDATIPKREPRSGEHLLHYAVNTNNVDVVQVLLENHANVNISAEDGITPLHLAALNDNADMVKLLLEYKADPNAIYPRNGKKPRDMAWKPEVIKLFDNYKKNH